MTENTKALDALAERINNGHQAYLATARKALEHALDAGATLHEVKTGLPHGEWLPWLKANCPGISERSAQRYIRLAMNRDRLREKSATVADLTLREADRILSDRDLAPPRGCAMQAIWEDGEVYIVPAAKHPGFFYVAIVLDVDGGGAVVEGFSRPVRVDGVAMFFDKRIRSLIPDGIEWETFRAPPWEYNLYLGRHNPLSSSRTTS